MLARLSVWFMPLYVVCITDVVVRDPTYRGAYRAAGYVIHHTFLVRTACIVVAAVGVAQNVSLFMVRTGLTPEIIVYFAFHIHAPGSYTITDVVSTHTHTCVYLFSIFRY